MHSGIKISSFSFYKNFLLKIIIPIDNLLNSFNRRLRKKWAQKNKAPFCPSVLLQSIMAYKWNIYIVIIL